MAQPNLLDIDAQRLDHEQREPVPMVRPDGALVSVSNPDQALEQGYKHATSQQIAEMQKAEADKIKFDSPIKAGLAGAARGLSVGLSDLALTKSHLVDPETLQGLKEQNPVASNVGEIGGAIGGTLLAPGASLPGLLERGAAGLAERATANIASDTAKKIASRALNDAVQGAAYGAGSMLSEKALGNPDLTAEQVISQVGIGTLLGGTIGAGFTGAGIAARKTLAAAKIPDMLEKAVGGAFSRIAGTLSDKDPEAIQKLFTNRFKATISDDERQQVQNQIVDHIKTQYKALSDFSHATTQARPKQMGQLLEGQYGTSVNEHQLNAMDGMINQIRLSIAKMRSEPEIYTKVGTIRRLETIAQGLEDNSDSLVKRPDSFYGYMDKIKQKMDDLAKFEGIIPDSERDTIREVRRLRGELKTTLEDKDLWGIAGERQASYNKATNQRLTAEKKFLKQFAVKTTDESGNVVHELDDNKLHVYLHNLGQSKNGRKEKTLENFMAKANKFLEEARQVHYDIGATPTNVPNMSLPTDQMETVEANNLLRRLKSPYRGTGVRENLVGPQALMNVGGAALMGHPLVAGAAAVFNALSNPVSMIEKIAAIGQAKAKAVKLFDAHLDNMLQGKTADLATITAVDLAGRQHLLKDKESEHSNATIFQHRIDEINHLASNPELLNDRIAATTNSIQGVNQVQGQLAGKLGVAVQYLSQTAPKNPYANSLTKKAWQPKPTDMMKWNRRLAAIQNPYSVLQNTTTEGIDAIKNVYPEIYKAMTERVFEHVTGKKDSDIPYHAKLKLTRIFGLDLDRNSNAADVARLQSTYAQQAAAQAQRRSQSQMRVADQSQTATERLESKM
jgi:hypothetical protein